MIFFSKRKLAVVNNSESVLQYKHQFGFLLLTRNSTCCFVIIDFHRRSSLLGICPTCQECTSASHDKTKAFLDQERFHAIAIKKVSYFSTSIKRSVENTAFFFVINSRLVVCITRTHLEVAFSVIFLLMIIVSDCCSAL